MPFAGGSGSESDPYQIEDWTHMDSVRDNIDAHFVLNNDLDETTNGFDSIASETANGGDGWDPIVTDYSTPMTGSFDGNGHEIRDWYSAGNGWDSGFFGVIELNPLTSLGLRNFTLEADGDRVGGFAGQLESNSIFENCYAVEGSVTSTGGLVGGLFGAGHGTVQNCYSGVDVSGGTSVGGIVGDNRGGDLYQMLGFGAVSGDSNVGALVGDSGWGDVQNSFGDSDTTGQTAVIGTTGDGDISNNYMLSTSELQQYTTYTADGQYLDSASEWDIALAENHTDEAWKIDDGADYPRLGYQSTGDTSTVVSGTFDLDSVGEDGAKITVIDDEADPPETIGTDTTDGDGSWAVSVGYNTTVHCLAEYEDADGNLVQLESKPFVVVDGALPEPVGSPLHWWPLTEGSGTTTADEIGSADGTITGATWVSDGGTWVGDAALSGDGTDDYVDTGPNDSISGEIAIAATVNHRMGADTYSAREYIASGGYDSAENITPWEFGVTTDDELVVGSYSGPDDWWYNTTAPVSDIPSNTPTRLVGQYDGTAGEWQLYCDGALLSTSSQTTGAIQQEVNRSLLAQLDDAGSSNYQFEGTVDDVVLYDYALTDQEITDDYYRSPWTPTAPVGTPAAYWPFDEGSGTTLTDYEGSLDGTINGPTWVTGQGGSNDAYLSFDGTDDLVDLGSWAIPHTDGAFSFVIWTRPAEPGTDGGTVFGNWGEFTTTLSSSGNFYLRLDGNTITDIAGVEDVSNRWMMLAVTRDASGNITTYYDDVQLNTATHDHTPAEVTMSFGAQGASDGHYPGDIDYAAFYDHELTSQEVADIYNETSGNYPDN